MNITESNGTFTFAATDTTYSTVSKTSPGLCPQLPNETATIKYLRQDGTWVTPPDNNTWKANSSSSEGYVASGAGQANKVWKTDANGNPAWRSDANTATAVDNILDGSNNGMQITYAPYAAQQSKLSFDTSTSAPTRTDRLNLNGYLYATKFNVAGKAAVQYNSTEDCIEFIFA